MGLLDKLAEVAGHPDNLKLALRRAGNPELAKDALQQTYWAVTQTQHPELIRDLYSYFRRALINEIKHQLARSPVTPVEDVGETAERDPERGPSPGSCPPPSVESQAAERVLAEKLLDRLDRHRDRLTACVPTRSAAPPVYQAAVFAAARTLLCLLLQGDVTQADWNAVLYAAFPLWFGQLGLDDNASHQRLSRGRRDVKTLLQEIVPRAELST